MRVGDTVYMAGQIPLDPVTMQMVEGDIEKEAAACSRTSRRSSPLRAARSAQVVKVTIFLTDFANFAKVNEIMAKYFNEPYPARSTVGVAQLPRNARVEIECTLHLG